MRIILFISKVLFIVMFMLCIATCTSAQNSVANGFTLLQVLPLITFILALVTGMLNLYIMNKLGKTREEVLSIVRGEFKSEIHELETRMASKEQVKYVEETLKLMLNNIENKIDRSTLRDNYNDTRKGKE